MANTTSTSESFKAEKASVISRVKALIHEGNVRRVIVKQDERTIAEFPLTAGVIGAVLAPVVAAIGAVAALVEDCTIHVEREATEVPRELPAAGTGDQQTHVA